MLAPIVGATTFLFPGRAWRIDSSSCVNLKEPSAESLSTKIVQHGSIAYYAIDAYTP